MPFTPPLNLLADFKHFFSQRDSLQSVLFYNFVVNDKTKKNKDAKTLLTFIYPTCNRMTGDDDKRTNSFDGIQLRLMMQVHLV